MKPVFTENDITKIAAALGTAWKFNHNNYRLVVENETRDRKLSIEIYPGIPIGNKIGNLITVYTHNTHLQLHFCTGYVISDYLGEVTFVSEHQGKISGLIVEREAACSLYSNVDRSLLSGDFTQMGPEVMLSGIALSLTEHIIEAE
jgi:hypothetical protein